MFLFPVSLWQDAPETSKYSTQEAFKGNCRQSFPPPLSSRLPLIIVSHRKGVTMYRKSSGFDGRFCLFLSLPASYQETRGKGQAVTMGTISMSFTINLMLTFLMGVSNWRGEAILGSLVCWEIFSYVRIQNILLLQDSGFRPYFPLMKHCTNETGI